MEIQIKKRIINSILALVVISELIILGACTLYANTILNSKYDKESCSLQETNISGSVKDLKFHINK